MDELKQRQSIFSSEPTKAATLETPDPNDKASAERKAEAKEIAESLAGKAKAPEQPSDPSRYSPVTIPSDTAHASLSLKPLTEHFDDPNGERVPTE